jgi:hypothetical protein
MNTNLVSTHVFLYYEDTGISLLEELSKYYKGKIYLSLILNNKNNKHLLEYARKIFDIDLTYVENAGTDQYGFFHSMNKDFSQKPWIFFCHDKHPDKKLWMLDLVSILGNIEENYLLNNKCGMISCVKHINQVLSINDFINKYGNMAFEDRKGLVQSIHTIIWLKELQRILLEKFELIKEESLYPKFCSGNIFLARKNIIKKTHECIYESFFNKNVYRSDGEMAHALERFYFYVSECMGYHNLFI